MGLLSFIGKAIGAVANIATGGVAGAAYDIAKGLIGSKSSPMTHPLTQIPVTPFVPGDSTASILNASPVMPGGGIATPYGVQGQTSSPPATYGGARARAGGRKRARARPVSRKRKTARRSSGRKLKFGSPAYRKKYLGHK